MQSMMDAYHNDTKRYITLQTNSEANQIYMNVSRHNYEAQIETYPIDFSGSMDQNLEDADISPSVAS